MPVIAMTHEIGTQGDVIAAMLAQRLGIEFADQLFLEDRIVDRLHACKPLLGYDDVAREQPAVSRVVQTRDGRLDVTQDVAQSLVARVAVEEIRELAAYGNVLLKGWGAPAVLRTCADIFRMRITAPMDVRIQGLAARTGCCDERALRSMIETSDASLAGTLEPALGPGWRTGDDYHLVLGMQASTVEDAVVLLVDYIDAVTRCDRDLAGSAVRPRRTRFGAFGLAAGTDMESIFRAEQMLFG